MPSGTSRAALKSWGGLLALLLLLLPVRVGATPAGSPVPTAELSPSPAPAALRLSVQGMPRPGGVLFVSVKGVAGATVDCRWDGRSWPVAVEGDVARVLLPVSLEAKRGPRRVEVEAVDGASPGGLASTGGSASPGDGPPRRRRATATVAIRSVPLGHQSLWLPEAMLATYDSPRARKEDQRVMTALAGFTPQALWHGNFVRPTAGPQTTSFGIARTYNGWRKRRHRGIDIAAAEGAPVRASNDAVVSLVAPRLLVDGNVVVLDHGLGVGTTYLHMSRIEVRTGQRVRRGQVIGRVGSTGAGTGPHLHWACWVHGKPADPRALAALPAGWRFQAPAAPRRR